MEKTTYTATNGVTVVMHGTPSPPLLKRAASILINAERREENAA